MVISPIVGFIYPIEGFPIEGEMFCPCADSRWHESPVCVTEFSLL